MTLVEKLGKLNNVIQSCESQEQLITALRYGKLFVEQLPLKNFSDIGRYNGIALALFADFDEKSRNLFK